MPNVTLEDCTKKELLLIISRLRSRGSNELIIAHALADITYARVERLAEKADAKAAKYLAELKALRGRYDKIIMPYGGLENCPPDEFNEAAKLLIKIYAAQNKYAAALLE